MAKIVPNDDGTVSCTFTIEAADLRKAGDADVAAKRKTADQATQWLHREIVNRVKDAAEAAVQALHTDLDARRKVLEEQLKREAACVPQIHEGLRIAEPPPEKKEEKAEEKAGK